MPSGASLVRLVLVALALLSWLAPLAAAPAGPLKADAAFQLTAERAEDGALALSWQIAPGTYLYRDSLKATRAGAPVDLALPAGEEKDDPNFGRVAVHHGAVAAIARGLPQSGELTVRFQGCAEAGICYPPQTRRVDLASLAVMAGDAGGTAGAGRADARSGSSADAARAAWPKLWPDAGAGGGAAAGATQADAGARRTGGESVLPGTGPDAPALSAATRSAPAAPQIAPAAPKAEGRSLAPLELANIPAATASGSLAGAALSADAGASDGPDGARWGGALLSGGLWAMLAAFLGFGVVLAFTPCVFPMLPILAGILAGGGVRPSPARGALLAGIYGLAMALAYGLVGAVAGWSGANLQALLQAPLALGALAGVFVALALAMFGLFDLALPAGLTARLSGLGRGGSLTGAAGLGFASALVVGPCVTPPLAAAMLYAAQTGDAGRGAAALFALGLGMGLPLVVVGAFGARALPRSGPWLARIKQACGVLFLAVAALLTARLLSPAAALALWGALAIALGVWSGGLDRLNAATPWPRRLGAAAGVVALIYGATLIVGAAGGGTDPLRPLAFLAAPAAAPAEAPAARIATSAELDSAVAAAGGAGRPVLVSFTADWCTVCKSNAAVMAEPDLAARLARLPQVAADVTDYDADARALMSRFAVIGPPTLFLMDAAGREVPGSRHIGALTRADLDRLISTAGL